MQKTNLNQNYLTYRSQPTVRNNVISKHEMFYVVYLRNLVWLFFFLLLLVYKNDMLLAIVVYESITERFFVHLVLKPNFLIAYFYHSINNIYF